MVRSGAALMNMQRSPSPGRPRDLGQVSRNAGNMYQHGDAPPGPEWPLLVVGLNARDQFAAHIYGCAPGDVLKKAGEL
jgi:hypothetical protein